MTHDEEVRLRLAEDSKITLEALVKLIDHIARLEHRLSVAEELAKSSLTHLDQHDKYFELVADKIEKIEEEYGLWEAV